jgi:transcriptional accessory protein Tex/SPT6
MTAASLKTFTFRSKPKRKTKAAAALERGLGPLSEYIWDQSGSDPVGVFCSAICRGGRRAFGASGCPGQC